MKKVKYTKHITSKGLKILNFYDPDTKRIGIEFMTKASSSINPKGKEGLAHFVEHMLLKETKAYPDEIEFSKAFEEIGAHQNAGTSSYQTSAYVTGGAQDFERILFLLRQSVAEHLLTSKAIKAERKVIEKEIIRKNSDENSLVGELMNSIMYSNSPLSFGNLGSMKTLSSITKNDLKDFVDNYYLTNNSIICVWGGARNKDVFKSVEKAFSFLKNKDWEEPVFTFNRKKHFIISKRKSDQVTIKLAFRLPNDRSKLYVTSLLRRTLCGGFSSRFVDRLRVKESLIYGWSSYSDTSHDTAGIYFQFSTAKKSYKKLLRILSEEIVKFKEKGLNKNELEHVKAMVIKPFVWNMERVGDYANWYEGQELYHPEDIETPEEYVKSINSITKKQVKDYAKKYLTQNNWYMSLVGNVNEEPKLDI